MLTTAPDLPERLATVLREEQQQIARGWRMSPQLSYGRHAGPPSHTARTAAVVLLLFRRNARWHVPLTERPKSLTRHGGQISLPGGAIDPGESAQAAALRELDEELGVGRTFEIVGRLPDCYVFASDFAISPWIAATDDEPVWQPNEREVQSVVELPLDLLLDERAFGRLTIERGPLAFHAPCLKIGTARVWGATCIILGDFADALRHLMEDY